MEELNKLFGSTEQLWQSIKNYASKAGKEATRLVLELYYVVMSPDTPAIDKTIIIAALGYQLLPRDFMGRDKHVLLGLLGNGAALILAYNRVKARVTPQIENQVNAILDQWFSTNNRQQQLSYAEEYCIPQNDANPNNCILQPDLTPKRLDTNDTFTNIMGINEDRSNEDVIID